MLNIHNVTEIIKKKIAITRLHSRYTFSYYYFFKQWNDESSRRLHIIIDTFCKTVFSMLCLPIDTYSAIPTTSYRIVNTPTSDINFAFFF